MADEFLSFFLSINGLNFLFSKVPGSILWLLKFPKEAEPHLQREFRERKLDPARLWLSEKFASHVHLNVKRAATMLLDTLDYNAHVSGLDALWAGMELCIYACICIYTCIFVYICVFMYICVYMCIYVHM